MGNVNPFGKFEVWFADAVEAEPKEPNAMTIATVDSDGMPSARVVLMKDVDEAGFVFYTNTLSQKGRELATHPKACLNFYWKSLDRQVRIRGEVLAVTDAEADAYFASRDRESQVGAWASHQSQELPDRDVLKQRVKEFEVKYEDQEVPRPPHWSGYRVDPEHMEFWQGLPFRLHHRETYVKENDAWRMYLQYP